MRKRYGQAERESEVERDKVPDETEPTESSSNRVLGNKEFSWITAITVGAQLTLDIIRVVREATDLKRKLLPVKGSIAGQTSGRESG